MSGLNYGPSSIARTTLNIPGLRRPFSFVQWTDVHLCDCDARNAGLLAHMKKRAERFGGAPTALALRTAAEIRALRPDFVVITGDLVDQPTEAAIESGRKVIDALGVPVHFAVGNHEWCGPITPFGREHWRPRLAAWSPQPMEFHAAEHEGVKLVFIDNSNYQLTEHQLAGTHAALADGKPAVLFGHIPWYIDTLVPDTVAAWGIPILVGATDISLESRRAWGIADTDSPATAEFCRLMRAAPNVKAAFAGHVHFEHEDCFGEDGRTQYVTGRGFEGHYRIVSVTG